MSNTYRLSQPTMKIINSSHCVQRNIIDCALSWVNVSLNNVWSVDCTKLPSAVTVAPRSETKQLLKLLTSSGKRLSAVTHGF